MVAVTISTKRDRSKIDWAGVDTGAKIFVGLKDGCIAPIGDLPLRRNERCKYHSKITLAISASIDRVSVIPRRGYRTRSSFGSDTVVERATNIGCTLFSLLVHDGSGHEIQHAPEDAVKFGKHNSWCRDMLWRLRREI